MTNRSIQLLFLLLATLATQAQKKQLTFNDVFTRAISITKPAPGIVGWADDDHYLERRALNGKSQLYSVDARTGNAVIYAKAEPRVSSVGIIKDDIAFTDSLGNTKQVTNKKGLEQNPLLSPDNKWVAFTRDNNLFAVEIATGKEVQFTFDGSNVILNGYASWVYYEEILGRASAYKAFWWSPDSKHISFMRFDDSAVPMFPIYYSEGQHGYIEETRYPKAGDRNPEVKVGIVSVNNPAITWADFNEKNDQYFGMPVWTPEGKLWIQWMPRSQDNLKIYDVNLLTGAKQEIYDETQKTWISLDDADRITFIPELKKTIIKSDKSGWAHLYLYDYAGKFSNAITSGDYTVSKIVKIDTKAKTLYFSSRKENSTRMDFYKIKLDGTGLTRLTFGEYTHTILPSPNVKYFITNYSNLETPNTVAVVDGKGKLVRDLGSVKGTNFDEYAIPVNKMVRIKSADGLFDLPMIITYPADFDSTKKYPVLMSIYGGPDAGQTYDGWRFNPTVAWWAQEGIIQVAMDNRSSGHFGKKGMNFIHRQLGKYEIEDFMQGAKWLKGKSYIDGSKICITGASFGGYLTCMALTYGASEFTHGIANASVTDWKLYDTHYTERFMDTPQENPDGYKNTAPATYLNNYKGLLRIVHGTADDNVHMQNSIQFTSALQDAGKHFEFMLYSGERHGIGAISRNKQMHLRADYYRFYYQNLLNKEVPKEFNK